MLTLTLALAMQAADTVSYDRPDAWLCRPGRQDACAIDLTSTVITASGERSLERFAPDPAAPIDCFYVYPTVSQDSATWSDLIAGEEERNVIRQQFARFASVCRPFAPLYRQVTLQGLRLVLNGQGGADVSLTRGRGYNDVLAAWRHYLTLDNRGRGVVLVGHSQGAMVLTELVRQEIDGKPIQARLISALLLGTSVAVPRGGDVGGAFQSLPLCRRSGQVGCIISFAAFRDTLPPSARTLFGRVAGEGMEAACTNPAALAGGSAPLRAYLTGKGSLITGSGGSRPQVWLRGGSPVETPFVSVPGLVSASCVSDGNGSRLAVTVHGKADDPRADDIPGDIGAGTPAQAQWGLHLIDVNLVMGDLLDVVRLQAKAWLSR